MIGTGIDLGATLAGAAAGLFLGPRFSSGARQQGRYLLALAAILFGLKMTWENCSGGIVHLAWQYFASLLLLVAGNAIGLLLRLQRGADWLKRLAANPLAEASLGLIATPLLVIGILAEASFGDSRPLVLKAAADGLLAFTLAEKHGRIVLAAVVPLGLIQGGLEYGLIQADLEKLLQQNGMHALGMAAGLILLCSAVALADFRKVNALNYLPALLLALLAGRWW